MRYKLVVEYDGTDYCGWQVQPNGRTIQGQLEEAVLRLVGQPVRVAAAGRTDAGVHASGQVVSFCLERAFPPEVMLRALNALTPRDISIRTADVAGDDFDPRRGATSRVYVYQVWNARWPSPFWRRYAWHVARPLDADGMQAAAQALLGDHDFSAFRAAGCDAAHPQRQVLRSGLERVDERLVYTIEANAFLRCMVRNIVGTLVEIGLGTRPADDIARILASRDRARAGTTAPPHGLCLTRVNY